MDHDLLSDLLRTVRLSGAVFFDVGASAPWVATAPPSQSIAAKVMPGAQHVIEYHVLAEGSCWARLHESDDEPVQLTAGSAVMFPHGDPHTLASDPRLGAPADPSVFESRTSDSRPFYLRYGSEPCDQARIICGFLGCDVLPFNPLMSSLPRMLHVAGDEATKGLLGPLIRAAVDESSNPRVGSGGVLSKLSELIFIEVIRRYAEQLPESGAGWLAGLRDPGIGRALRALHAAPGQNWTVGDIAREAGMSRTVLAERFTECLGTSPMNYLLGWRMQLAATRLSTSARTLAEIAAEVGYASEAAFSRAFKRSTGFSPGAWRTRAGAGD